MRDEIRMLPAVALRGIMILPGMIAHFDISREVSIKAVERILVVMGSSKWDNVAPLVRKIFTPEYRQSK